MKSVFSAFISGLFGIVLLAATLFWPAGTFDYWQGWVFIAVFMATTSVPSVYLAIKNPTTLQRRMHAGPTAETRIVQKIVIWGVVASAFGAFVLSGLDHRFGWSNVPITVVGIGNILVAVGLILAQVVVFQNNFAGASIQVEAEQPLVSTGLYGLVRHPMYSGAVLMMFGTPLALGSYWALLVSFAAIPVFGVRIADEEKMLRDELDGYDEYTHKVPYRLVPYVW